MNDEKQNSEAKVRFESLHAQLELQRLAIEEIRITQMKVAGALLGSLEQNVPGLIEEARNIKKIVEILVTDNKIQDKELKELSEFRSSIKKIVAGIALIVPFVFEIVRGIILLIWDYLKNGAAK